LAGALHLSPTSYASEKWLFQQQKLNKGELKSREFSVLLLCGWSYFMIKLPYPGLA